MLNTQLKTLLSSFLLISFFCTPSFSQQETPNQLLQEKPETEVTYSVTEVPKKIEEVTVYLNDLESIIAPASEIVKIETTYVSFDSTMIELRNEADLDKLDEQFSRNLKDLRQRWGAKHKQVLDWQKIIEDRSTNLDEEKLKFENIKETWKRTYDNAKKEKAPKVLLKSIRTIQTELNLKGKDLIKRSNTLLSYQSRIAEVNIDLSNIVTKLDEALNLRRTEIFTRDAPPLWAIVIESPDTVSLTNQVEDIWVLYKRSVSDFIETESNNLIYDLLLFLLFFLFVYGLKYFSRSIEAEDDAVKFAIRLLDRQIAISFLIFLIFSSLLYTDAPDVLKSFFKIVMLIPLLRILTHIINPILKLPLYGLTILFLLNQFQRIAVINSFLGRSILLLLSILAIAGLIWIIRSKVFEKSFEGEKALGYVLFGNKAALILISFALIGNILGYVSLAELIVSGTLNSIYIAILLITAVAVLNALIILFLKTKPAQRLRVVQYQHEKVQVTSRKIIRLAAIILWLATVLNSYNIYDPVLVWLSETLNRKWEIGSFSMTIVNILVFIGSIWAAVIISRTVRFFLEGDILPRLKLPRGVPGAISSLTTYSILVLGILVALFGLGIDLSKLTILVGALGVGIGFGMQDLVNNFISGLILIFERPIQVGDAISVADISGRVKSIGIRSSIIRNWSGADVIVPNGHLISNKLTNWTMTDQLRRIEIKVGVMYGSDVTNVMEILLNCAKENQKILTRPASYVLFQDFGESYLEFELRCWTSDYTDWLDIRSDLRVAINNSFEKEGIVIPFPQRDLHIITDRTQDHLDEDDTTRRKKRLGTVGDKKINEAEKEENEEEEKG
jgi:small-conductance mechanosensitive channel